MRTGIDAAGRQVMWSLWLFPPVGLRNRLGVSKAEEAQGSWLQSGQENKGFCGTTFCGEVEPVPRPGWWVGCVRAQAGLVGGLPTKG